MRSDRPVRVVVTRPLGTSRLSGRDTTWGISTCGVRGISWSRRRSTPGRSAARTFTRTACRIARRVGPCGETTASWSLVPRAKTGARQGENKAQARRATACLAGALADCAGAVAAEERSDGPVCRRAAGDHRRATRLLADVFDHDPPHDDLRACLRRLPTAWAARALTRGGITTAGAARAPEPWAERVSGGPHPSWAVHGRAEGGKAGLGAGASARPRRAAQQPKGPTGRPSTPVAKQAACTNKRREAPRAAWCPSRSLVVHRPLHTTERQTLGRVSRGWPP